MLSDPSFLILVPAKRLLQLLRTRRVLGSIPALAFHFCSIIRQDEQFRHFAEDRGAEKVGRKEHPNTYNI
jgi:hypothetical protein